MEYKGKKFAWPLSKIDLEYFYINEKLSTLQIGLLFSKACGTVSHFIKKYSIPNLAVWERRNFPTELNEIEKEIVLGYLLGDGHLGVNSKYAHLRVSQSLQQYGFVEQMFTYLERWASNKPREDKKLDKRQGKEYYSCRFDTVAHPAFQTLYELCYKDGVKTVTLEWLSYIGDLGLALWYEGDGGLHKANGPLAVLKTNSFTLKEHEIMVGWFKSNFNIEAYYRLTKKGYNICIIDGITFRKCVEPHIIPYFKYKLPRERMRKPRNLKWARNSSCTK